jgi:hypothetical protein
MCLNQKGTHFNFLVISEKAPLDKTARKLVLIETYTLYNKEKMHFIIVNRIDGLETH